MQSWERKCSHVLITFCIMTTLYDILGVDETADQRDIRKAYLKKVVSEHPDKGGSATSFDRLQNAYQILSNPEERSAYDDKRVSGQRDTRLGQEEGLHHKDATTSAYYTEKDGVKVEYHGQRRASVGPRRKTEACAGQGKEGVQFSNAIEERKREYHQDPTDPLCIKNLAMAYIDRARYHAERERHHHAAFDVQEAEHVSPGLLAELVMAQEHSENAGENRWVGLLSSLMDSEGLDSVPVSLEDSEDDSMSSAHRSSGSSCCSEPLAAASSV